MRGGLALIAVLLASLALSACGGEEEAKFSDDKIANAIDVRDDAVGDDPFCIVRDYLNDSAAVNKAGKKDGPAISSAQGNVGVVVETPFPQDCAAKVRKGLNKLDPKEKQEDG